MERIELTNGVLVEVEDKTTLLSGDLYMIHLAITFSIALEDDDVELRQYCPSERLGITRALSRPGVHLRELDEVKRRLKESFLNTTRIYMENPKFVGRFKQTCLARFREEQDKARKASIHEE
jgi:hypothetical protein